MMNDGPIYHEMPPREVEDSDGVRIISTGRTLEALASEASGLPGRGCLQAVKVVGQTLDVRRGQYPELCDGLRASLLRHQLV